MKTKAEIIQRLLDEKHIDVNEAMVLLEKEKEYVYPAQYPYYWWTHHRYVVTDDPNRFCLSNSRDNLFYG